MYNCCSLGAIPYNVIQLMDCLGQSGVYASIYSTQTHITKDMFHISRHRLGIVTLIPANQHIDQDHIMLQVICQSFIYLLAYTTIHT